MQELRLQNIKYSLLSDLLAAGKWEEADAQTAALLLKLADRESSGWLKRKDIEKISSSDLQMLDRLWVKHSNGHFGFSTQQRIWYSCNDNYTNFGQRVGWHKDDRWLDYDGLIFSLEAPVGHLPAVKLLMPMPGGEQVFSFVLGSWRVALLSDPFLLSGASSM